MRNTLAYLVLIFLVQFKLQAQTPDTIQGVIILNEFNINTPSLEFSPSFHEDGIVFIASADLGKGIKSNDTRIRKIAMTIYTSKRGQDGKLATPTLFSKALTSKFHEGPLTFNPSGDVVYFTQNNTKDGRAIKSKDGITRLNIYEAIKTGEEWKDIKSLPFNNDDYDCVHPAISQDGNTLYFASDKPGGSGGMDLWMSTKASEGWGEPVNLGPNINTGGNDVFPYFHSDGNLYFATDGRKGPGAYDMYYTILDGNTWSDPIALPYPFNTSSDDFGLIVDQEARNGYFTSNRSGGRGEDDIYSFIAIDNFNDLLNGSSKKRKNRKYTVYVSDKVTGESIEGATVSLMNMSEMTLASVYTTTDENGKLIQVQPDPNNPESLVLNVNVDANGETKTTDSEGKSEFNVAKGSLLARATKAGYKTKQVTTSETETSNDLLILLEKGGNTVRFNGLVLDPNRNQPVAGADVEIYEKGTDKVTRLKTNKAGQFDADLEKGKEYEIVTFVNGKKETRTVKVPFDAPDLPMVAAFTGTPAQGFGVDANGNPLYDENGNYIGKGFVEGAVIRLPNIYYNFNDASIRPDAAKDLNALSTILTQIPQISIELASHTDSRGGTAYNKNLSQRRANEAIKFLTGKGVKRNRMKGLGYGEGQLKNGCNDNTQCSELEHQINRRTEFRISKMPNGLNVQYINNSPSEIGGISSVVQNTSEENQKTLNPADYEGSNELFVIAGTFSSAANADKRLQEIKANGFGSAYTTTADNAQLTAVVVAKLTDAKNAVDMVSDLRTKGFKSYIKKR